MGHGRINRVWIILGLLATSGCDNGGGPGQLTEPEIGDPASHNAGAHCAGCHSNMPIAGTVFATSDGLIPLAGVSASLIGVDGQVTVLEPTNGAGNLVGGGIPTGRYLITIGGRESRSWHLLPAMGSCNGCHTPGAEEDGVTLPALHTRLQQDNLCTHCHHFPATMAPAALVPPGVLSAGADAPELPGSRIEILGSVFSFDPETLAISTLRPDIFAPGFFSMFDAILAVATQQGIDIQYHFDEERKTHFIDSVDGVSGDYWYHFSYDTGGGNANELRNRRAYRWDEALWRSGVWVQLVEGEKLDEIRTEYLEEIQRERDFGHLIPRVTISINPSDYEGNPSESGRITVTRNFTDVLVTPHGTRSAGTIAPFSTPFQPEVVTSLDILLSLQDQGALDLVTSVFYTRFSGNFIDSHYVVAMGFPGVGTAHASGRQGFVYSTNNGTPQDLPNDAGRTFHITSDISVVHAPDFSQWRWIELGNPYYEANPSLSEALARSLDEDHNAIGRGFNLHRPVLQEEGGSVGVSVAVFEAGPLEVSIRDGSGRTIARLAEGLVERLGIHRMEWSQESTPEETVYLVARRGHVHQTRRLRLDPPPS